MIQSSSDLDDGEAWDKLVTFALRLAGATALGALYYIDLTMMDVPAARSGLLALLVIGCYIGQLGVWTMRKIAVALTVYAGGYLVGALPSVQAIGASIGRAL